MGEKERSTITATFYGDDKEIAEQFRERVPEDKTNAEYLAFLLDKRHAEPDDADKIAAKVEQRLTGQMGIEKHEVRDAARSGAKQGLREVQ